MESTYLINVVRHDKVATYLERNELFFNLKRQPCQDHELFCNTHFTNLQEQHERSFLALSRFSICKQKHVCVPKLRARGYILHIRPDNTRPYSPFLATKAFELAPKNSFRFAFKAKVDTIVPAKHIYVDRE